MNYSLGRKIFFDSIAKDLLDILPTMPFSLAIRIDEHLGYDDQIKLCESLNSFINPDDYCTIMKFDKLISIEEGKKYIIDCCKKKTSGLINEKNYSAIFFNYQNNDNPDLVEIIIDFEKDKNIIENAIRLIFEKSDHDYEPLALHRFINNGFKIFKTQYSLFESSMTIPIWEDENRLELFCYNISRNWYYDGKLIDGKSVHSWILQFEESGFIYEACSLLIYLKNEGYITLNKVQENINKVLLIHKKQKRTEKTHYVSVQPFGKSESLLSYSLKSKINFENFPDIIDEISSKDETAELICFDDVIISGGSVLKFLFNTKYNKKASTLIKCLEEKKIQITIICSHADVNGIKNIVSDKRANRGIKVKFAELINDKSRVFSKKSKILPNKNKFSEFKDFCFEKGKKLAPSMPLGWQNAEWLIVFDYSVPNGTIPIIWNSSHEINWSCIFQRNRTNRS